MQSLSRVLILFVSAVQLAAAQEKIYAGVKELLDAAPTLRSGAPVRILRATVAADPVAGGTFQERTDDEMFATMEGPWNPMIMKSYVEDPHLDFMLAGPSGSGLRVRLITGVLYLGSERDSVDKTSVTHPLVRAGNIVEVRGRLLRTGTERFLFVEPVLRVRTGVHVDGSLRILGNTDGSPVLPAITAVSNSGWRAVAGRTLEVEGYFFGPGTKLRVTGADGVALDVPVESIDAGGRKLVARLPGALAHGRAALTVVGGLGREEFAAMQPPVVTSVPATLRTDARFEIRGRNLTSFSLTGLEGKSPSVYLDGSSEKVVEFSADRIVVELDRWTRGGSRLLEVRTDAGRTAGIQVTVVELPGPTVESVEVTGPHLLLRGTDFGDRPRVSFALPGARNKQAGQVVMATPTTILVRMPAGATGGHVSVVGGLLDKEGPAVPFTVPGPGITHRLR